jgi:hypothetical protein
MAAIFTNGGLTLIATALQTASANVAITYVAIGTGAGTLSGAVTSGVPLTSLPLDATLPANIGAGASLTVTDGTNSETVTCNGGASAGATSIPINSWTPAHNYAAHTTGVAPAPLAADTGLYNEMQRVSANTGVAGASPGESLNSGYFDGTQATAVYMQVGYVGGSTATASANTGTLIAEDIQYWNHTLNADSATFQLDSTI